MREKLTDCDDVREGSFLLRDWIRLFDVQDQGTRRDCRFGCLKEIYNTTECVTLLTLINLNIMKRWKRWCKGLQLFQNTVTMP